MSELLRPLAFLQPLADLARLVVFLVFVALGLRVAWRPGRRAVDGLIGYVLIVTCTVGLLQQESWPFTQWALVHHLSPRQGLSWEIRAEDAGGRSYEVDPRVLQPLAPEELGAWLLSNLERSPAEGRASVGRWLLQRAEAGRARFAATGRPGTNDALLGPFTAPYHFLPRVVWRAGADVPVAPLVRVALWRLDWDVDGRARDESGVARRLLLEFPP